MSSLFIPTIGVSNGIEGKPINKVIDSAVETVVAVMYNYYDTTLISDNSSGIMTSSTNKVILNHYVPNRSNLNAPMPLNSFLALFYPTNAGYFNVNPSNANNPAIILSTQTYTSSNSSHDNFSLLQFLLKAYCTNKGVNVNDLDPRMMVLLQKETFTTQSLATVRGTTIAMSWDEVINSLIASGVMFPSGNEAKKTSAVVPLCVVLNYHSFVLDIDLSIKFTYLVDITGYALPSIGSPAQPSYH
jgi:hypothetical protein